MSAASVLLVVAVAVFFARGEEQTMDDVKAAIESAKIEMRATAEKATAVKATAVAALQVVDTR